MDQSVVVFGLILLIAIGVVIGLAREVDHGSAAGAWRAIARERRRCWEEYQRNQELLSQIDKCEACPFRSRSDDRGGGS